MFIHYKTVFPKRYFKIIIKAKIVGFFIYDQLKNNLPETFSVFFTLNTQLHTNTTLDKTDLFREM